MPIVDEQAEKSLFGYMKDSVLIHEDILEPQFDKVSETVAKFAD